MELERTLHRHLALEIGWGLQQDTHPAVTAYRATLQAGRELLLVDGLRGLQEWLEAALRGRETALLYLDTLDLDTFMEYLSGTVSGERLGLLALTACWRAADSSVSQQDDKLTLLLEACAQRLGEIIDETAKPN